MVGVLIVLVLVWLGVLLYAKACKKRQLFYRILRMSVGLYWVLIFCLSVANRQPSVRSLHLVPEAWLAGESGFHESNVILSMINFCYYIPYGMLLAGQGKERKHYLRAVWLSAVTSIMMEALQYCTARETASTADVLANVAGGAAGMLLVLLWRCLRKQ